MKVTEVARPWMVDGHVLDAQQCWSWYELILGDIGVDGVDGVCVLDMQWYQNWCKLRSSEISVTWERKTLVRDFVCNTKKLMKPKGSFLAALYIPLSSGDSGSCNTETVRVKSKVLPESYGPLGGADLRSIGPQLDTSLHCKDRGYRASASRDVSVYSPAVRPVQRHMCVNNLPRVVTRWRRGRGLNSRPLDHESDALTTTPPSHWNNNSI